MAKNSPIETFFRETRDSAIRRAFDQQCVAKGGLVPGRGGRFPAWVLDEVAAGKAVSHISR